MRHDVKPGLLDQFEHVVQHGIPKRLNYDYPKPIGMWYSEFGPIQRGTYTVTTQSRGCEPDRVVEATLWTLYAYI